MNTTIEDRYYMPPDPPDTEQECVYETRDDNCGAPADGLLCERHEEVITADEYTAYQRHYEAA